jgi:hypothetical protein
MLGFRGLRWISSGGKALKHARGVHALHDPQLLDLPRDPCAAGNKVGEFLGGGVFLGHQVGRKLTPEETVSFRK